MSLAARRIWPDEWDDDEPITPVACSPLAKVIPIRPYVSAPHRRSINGHHPDCPYPTRDVAYCHVCQGVRKGAL